VTTFAYTSGDPAHLTAAQNASMADIQGSFVDLRTFVNGNISDINLSSSAAINENKLAVGSSGLAKGAFSAYRSTNQAIATGAGTVVVFDAEEFDVSGWFDTATGKFTPQVPGYYRLSANISSAAVQAADIGWAPVIRKNGASYKNLPNSAQRNSATPVSAGGSVIAQANGTTDYFEVLHTHTAGTPTNVGGGAALTYFQGEFIGRS